VCRLEFPSPPLLRGLSPDAPPTRRETALKLYRYLTGFDDAAFCKKVSEALNRGWSLEGSTALSFDPVQGRAICGQAVVKEVPGEWTEEMKGDGFKLSQQ
jgi:hypothetical protein